MSEQPTTEIPRVSPKRRATHEEVGRLPDAQCSPEARLHAIAELLGPLPARGPLSTEENEGPVSSAYQIAMGLLNPSD